MASSRTFSSRVRSLPLSLARAIAFTVIEASLRGRSARAPIQRHRRFGKLYEELGEVSEAFLDVTGSNSTRKTHADVLEEQVDVYIVMLDIAIQQALVHSVHDAVDNCRAEVLRLLEGG